jgi:predicted DCC family thiol-disulfide oxidoreductase YuxK
MGPLIVFDGECGLCSRAIQFVVRHDQRAVFKFAALQSATGREICRAQGLEAQHLRTLVVVSERRVLLRSDAVIEIARQLGGGWKLLTFFKVMPRSGRDWLYDFVAHRRHRLGGTSPACAVAPEDVRRRFLP